MDMSSNTIKSGKIDEIIKIFLSLKIKRKLKSTGVDDSMPQTPVIIPTK
jgi:hypothetical protein